MLQMPTLHLESIDVNSTVNLFSVDCTSEETRMRVRLINRQKAPLFCPVPGTFHLYLLIRRKHNILPSKAQSEESMTAEDWRAM